MADSILNDTKKMLGIDESYSAFDLDVMLLINSTLSTLDQLGVGPEGGISITGPEATWVDLIGNDPRFNSVKTYVYLKVRMAFDPPQVGYVLTAMKEQIQELEWRLNVVAENDKRELVTNVDAPVLWTLDANGNFPPEALPGQYGIDSTGTVWRLK